MYGNMNEKIDLQLLRFIFSYGDDVTIKDIELNAERTEGVIKVLTQPSRNTKPITDAMKAINSMTPLPGIAAKEYIHNMVIKNVNENLKLLRILGGPLGTKLSEEANQQIRDIIQQIHEFRLVIGVEQMKPVTEYVPLAEAIQIINQLILDAALLVKSIIDNSIKDIKTHES
jgi:hypothetical protein